jgi:TRAP-type mannitol/chloroaromatic compound transport system substrate-binding protein
MVEKASNGRFIIQANQGGAIVPSDTELDPTSKGVLQMGSNGPILWKALLPQAPLFSTFIGGPTAMQYFMWFQVGDGFKLMKEMFATKSLNVTPVAAWAELPEVFLYTNFPITNLDAVKGKKMRLLGDEAVIFGKLGVSAVSTPSGEIYQAMKSGVIDGFQHSNLGTDEMMGFHEVAKYAYMGPTRQPTDMYVMYVNNDAWAKLPDDLKQILTDAGWAEGINHYSLGIQKAVTVAAKWQAAGVKIEPVPKFFEDAVVKSAMEFYAEMKAKDPFFAKVYDSLMAWKNLVNAAFPTL